MNYYSVKDTINFFTANLRERNEITHNQAVYYLRSIFNRYKRELETIKALASKIKKGIELINPFIQSYTQLICPSCKEKCCINKHGFYNFEDLVYLHALEIDRGKYDFSGKDLDPCQFLSTNGCILERQFRPSGCNWYFCDYLLQEMEKSPNYNQFEDSMTTLAKLWMDLIDQFHIAILKANQDKLNNEMLY